METTITLRLSTDLKNRVKKQASKEKKSTSFVFRTAAEQYLKKEAKK